jgi:hypothetical protein
MTEFGSRGIGVSEVGMPTIFFNKYDPTTIIFFTGYGLQLITTHARTGFVVEGSLVSVIDPRLDGLISRNISGRIKDCMNKLYHIIRDVIANPDRPFEGIIKNNYDENYMIVSRWLRGIHQLIEV